MSDDELKQLIQESEERLKKHITRETPVAPANFLVSLIFIMVLAGCNGCWLKP